MQVIDDPVERRQMDRFDDAHVVKRDVEALLGEGAELAAGEAGAAERLETVAVGPVDGLEHIGAVAGATDGDQQVAGTSQVLELLDKDAIEALVVAPGEDIGGVVGEAEDT